MSATPKHPISSTGLALIRCTSWLGCWVEDQKLRRSRRPSGVCDKASLHSVLYVPGAGPWVRGAGTGARMQPLARVRNSPLDRAVSCADRPSTAGAFGFLPNAKLSDCRRKRKAERQRCVRIAPPRRAERSEEHTSELQSLRHL